MKKGELEGIILTIHDEEFGYKGIKWKAAHELQSVSNENFLKVNEMKQLGR